MIKKSQLRTNWSDVPGSMKSKRHQSMGPTFHMPNVQHPRIILPLVTSLNHVGKGRCPIHGRWCGRPFAVCRRKESFFLSGPHRNYSFRMQQNSGPHLRSAKLQISLNEVASGPHARPCTKSVRALPSFVRFLSNDCDWGGGPIGLYLWSTGNAVPLSPSLSLSIRILAELSF